VTPPLPLPSLHDALPISSHPGADPAPGGPARPRAVPEPPADRAGALGEHAVGLPARPGALPQPPRRRAYRPHAGGPRAGHRLARSEEHTSELQSRFDLVCRLLLAK